MTVLGHFGRYVLLLKGMFTRPEQQSMYFQQLMHECVETGWRSMTIVIIISFFIGAVSTVQTAYQLVSPIIPQAAIAQIVRETVLLEFAPTLICIVLAGVVGSKITSEIGNMRVSEQIDALEIMGINPKSWIVLPKITAAIIMIPLLVIFAAALGIIGGRVAGEATGIIPSEVYDQGLLWGFKGFTIVFMLTKAYCFAFLIASIACYFGYYVEGGALQIGRATTRSVIVTCIAIIACDYILSLILLG